jgi:two-component system, OmpR family, sensor kinase
MPPHDGDPKPRRLFSSARARILASYLILLLFSTAVGTIVLREVLLARAGERVDDALVQETQEFKRLAEDGRNPETGQPFGLDVGAIFDVFLDRNVPAESEAFYTFFDGADHDERFAPSLEERRLAQIDALAGTTVPRRGEFEHEDETRFRYVTVPVFPESGDRTRGGVFAVVIDLSQELDEVNEALQIAVGVNIGVLILASMLAWVIAGRVLQPLRLLRDTARSISESDLTRRIPVEGDDELADLARTFNEMLDRLEEAFASQKSFISDAGHELRTPITIIRGHLDVMGDDPEERRETLDLVRDELDRMSRLVNDLLLLAKATRPDFLQPETVDLDDLTRELFAKASALAQRDWRLSSVGTGRIVADRQRVTQAVMNLSQNAVTHTLSGDAVELGSELRNGRVRLWVKDTGPGVPEHEQARIFERFVRLDRAPAGEGAGLGLAITRAVAEAHGGRVELDSRPGGGARFTVIIPTEPPQEVSPR